ncbi:MAG: hypothetical protein H6652_13115 [Ardenticatenaceae bacterium]|nr:hypothetical protein [Ardenticatenaceae bacterium]MCB8947316.1 hypothetical protein [Ardenticatenaceae bacterium]
MSDKTFKKIIYGISAFYIVLFVTFVVSDLALRPSSDSSGSRWLFQVIGEQLFITLVGLVFLIYGISNSIVSWTRTADEFMALQSTMWFGRMRKRRFLIVSNRYVLWMNRLISPIFAVAGLVAFSVGLYFVVLFLMSKS